MATALAALPARLDQPDRPYVGEAEVQLYRALDMIQGLVTLEHEQTALWRVEVSPDGRLLATATNAGEVRLYGMPPAAPTLVSRFADQGSAVLDLCFGPQGDYLATASADGTARIIALPGGSQKLLRGHQDAIGAIDCSSTGSELVTAAWDGAAVVWDARSGAVLRRLGNEQSALLTSAHFSPDGDLVLTTSMDGSATLWRWRDGVALQRLAGQGGPIWWGAFDPAGGRVLTAAEGEDIEGANPGVNPTERRNTLWLWDVASGRRLLALDGHAEAVLHAAFSPKTKQDPVGGGLIVTASRDGTARTWDSLSGRLLVTLPDHGGPVLRVAFDPSGERVATAARDGRVRLFDPRSGALIGFPARHDGAAVDVTFSTDGRHLVSAGEDGRALVLAAEPGRQLARFAGNTGPVGLVRLAPDDPRRVLTASRSHTVWGAQMVGDGTARLWDAEYGRELAKLAGHRDSIRAAAFAPDGRAIVTGSEDQTAILWTADGDGKWQLARRLAGHQGAILVASFDPTGQEILTAAADGTVRLWNRVGRMLQALRPSKLANHAAEARSAVFNHRGDRLATGMNDGSAWLWQRTGPGAFAELRQLDDGPGTVLAIQFAPDDHLLLTAKEGPNGAVQLWNGATGAPAGSLLGHGGAVAEAVFSPDGRWLATASEDQTAALWDVAARRQLSVMRGHLAGLPSLALTVIGGRPRVLTGSWDGSVRLWDGLTGQQLALFSGHLLGVPDVAIDPAGRFAVSVSWDGTARVWSMLGAGQELIDLARQLAAPIAAAAGDQP